MNFLDVMGIGLANEGVSIEILTKSGKPFSDDKSQNPHFTVLGQESDAYITCSTAHKKFVDLTNDNEDLSEEEKSKEIQDSFTYNVMAKVVIAWDNIYHDESLLECTQDNIKMILDNSIDTKNQVFEIFTKEELFRKK